MKELLKQAMDSLRKKGVDYADARRVRRTMELLVMKNGELEAGSVRLQATITHASLRERGWRPGSEVWLAFKATALRVIPP